MAYCLASGLSAAEAVREIFRRAARPGRLIGSAGRDGRIYRHAAPKPRAGTFAPPRLPDARRRPNPRLRSGETRSLDFDRADGPVGIRLGGLDVSEIQRLEVGWPSSRLTDLTLIDTPGLDSSSERTSHRTVEALVGEDERPGDADAVIYLMRHLHRRDATFLEAFEQRIGSASPVTAIGLLSRSDEIGAGRMDAMDSAARIAQR